jgi:hypothetical protein
MPLPLPTKTNRDDYISMFGAATDRRSERVD